MSKTVVNVNRCPTCENEGEMSPQFGLIACKSCREQTTRMSERTYEFVPGHIKEERKEFKKEDGATSPA